MTDDVKRERDGGQRELRCFKILFWWDSMPYIVKWQRHCFFQRFKAGFKIVQGFYNKTGVIFRVHKQNSIDRGWFLGYNSLQKYCSVRKYDKFEKAIFSKRTGALQYTEVGTSTWVRRGVEYSIFSAAVYLVHDICSLLDCFLRWAFSTEEVYVYGCKIWSNARTTHLCKSNMKYVQSLSQFQMVVFKMFGAYWKMIQWEPF